MIGWLIFDCVNKELLHMQVKVIHLVLDGETDALDYQTLLAQCRSFI